MVKWQTIAKALVSITSCVILLNAVNVSEIADKLSTAKIYWLCVVFGIIHLDRVFMVYKWNMLLSGSGVLVSKGTLIRAYYVASFWATFLPMTVGGDIVRAGWLMKKSADGPKIISSIVVERLLGALALFFLASLSLLPAFLDGALTSSDAVTTIRLALIITIIVTLLSFSPLGHHVFRKIVLLIPSQRISKTIEEVRTAIFAFKKKRRLLIIFFIFCVLEQIFPIIATVLLAKAFSIHLSLIYATVSVPILLAICRLPVSINGFGVQEGAYAIILSYAGIPLSVAISMSLADRVLLLLAALPGAFWSIPTTTDGVPRVLLTQHPDNVSK